MNLRLGTRIFLLFLIIGIAVWVIAWGIGITASIIAYFNYSIGAH